MRVRLDALALALSLWASGHDGPAAFVQEPIEFGETYTIQSETLGEARTINVWVPPHPDEDPRAPYRVLYLIDGGTQQDWFHITGLAQLGALSWTFEPMVVVGIETDDRQNELTPEASDQRYSAAFPTSGGAADFRAFLIGEVKPFIEANFPVGEQSALIGESLAGLFVADTYLNSPDAFGDYLSISPSLWWDDKALGLQAARLMAANEYEGKRLFIAAADEGGTMQQAIDQLYKAAVEAGVEVHFDDLSATETHATIFHQAALHAFRLLYAEPPYDYGPTPWYLIEGGEPEPAQD
ncbi:alpha/beta hydrolase [Henriciella barbarensis]|nr:alpha/beta hydrolase-fold protein [Henriciella barbarensis]